MKLNSSKCIWTAVIAAVAVCMTLSTAYADNLGNGYISNVTGVNGECVVNTATGNTGHKWDIQAGGTYIVTLSGIDDMCSQGNDSQIGVIVHNSTGGNIPGTNNPPLIANQLNNQPGVYTFTVTLTTQCLTMPIEYCTHDANNQPANLTGTGLFAQGFDGTGGDGKSGHLRTALFGENCTVTEEDTICQPQATPTPTPCTASIQACKYYDFNANGIKNTGEALMAWPFCLTSLTDPNFSPVQHTSSDGNCTMFSNLGPGSYLVTEGSATGFFGSTNSSTITIDHCDQTVTVNFGNYCTVPSGGLTLGFWSNKNGNKLITGNAAGTGTTLLPGVVTLLNSCSMRNANGSIHTFSGSSGGYTDFRNWLLSASATNMAYMLSAQMAALKLDVYFNKVDGGAYDLCSSGTVNQLISSACADLATNGSTLSGNVNRMPQEMWKNCMDAINNNGPVVPVTPCDHSGASVSCGE
jgi:hypothetical protein